MASIFNNASTRMFCISGELSDIFCVRHGWVMSFEELLVHHLQELGFGSVMFCSSQRGIFYSLNISGSTSFDILNGKKKKIAEKKDEPESKTHRENSAVPQYSNAGLILDDEEEENEKNLSKKDSTTKVSYTYPFSIEKSIVGMNRFMHDSDKPKALVFTSLEDVIKLDRTNPEVARKLFGSLEEWKALPNENQNICIFLSKTLDSSGLQNLLQTNRVAVLESLFLRNAEFNHNACLNIGAPMNDEIVSLLELLRIQGYTYKREDGSTFTSYLRFHRKEMEQIVRALSFCNRSSGFTQLKIMKEILERYMREQGTSEVMLTVNDIIRCYPRSGKYDDEQDPLETLRQRQGWEAAYHVLNSFITNHRSLYSDISTKGKAVEREDKYEIFVDRFEPGSCVEKDRGRIPNFVLQGPPGVGKTEIAGLIGRILQREGVLKSGHTVIGSRDKLVGEYVGSTAIKTAALIEEAQEGVLLVDEVYSIAEKRSEGGISYCDEVFNTIVAAMTNSNYHFCVIFAGYADRMHEVWEMNEGLYSRFSASNIITLTEYQPSLLQKIFESKIGYQEGSTKQVTVLSQDVIDGLPVFFENYFADRDRKNFGNARDVNNLVSEVKRSASYRHLLELEKKTEPPSDEERWTVTVEKVDFEDRISLFEKRGYSADDIYSSLYEYEGLEFLIDIFNNQLSIKVECQEKGLPYPGPSHMIWAGHPGTGKSTAAQLTANLYHALGILGGTEPIYVDASELVSKYVSGSAENMTKKIDEACQKNAVLVIEEAYQLLEQGGKDAIHAMLNRMETDRANFNIILILYKDKVQLFLDENPGLASRLQVYEFPDYNAKQLFNIFMKMCKKAKDCVSDDCIEVVKQHIQRLYDSGITEMGNARIIRQMHEEMKQRRYKRILGVIAASNYGADTPENRNKAAAARAMGTVVVPENAYIFTAEDVPTE